MISFRPSSAPQRRKNRCFPAFSLAEVTLVIGITALTLLPLVSLLPFGLDTLRKSASKSAEARMLQSIASDYQMRTWVPNAKGVDERVIKLDNTDYHFDEAGLPTTPGSFDHIYNARAIVVAENGTILNQDHSGGPNRYLRRLNIRITSDINNPLALNDNSDAYWERPLLIANLEQTGTLTPLP